MGRHGSGTGRGNLERSRARKTVRRALIGLLVVAVVAAGVVGGGVVYRAKKHADDLEALVPPQPAAVTYAPQLAAIDPTGPQGAPTARGVAAEIAAPLRNRDLGQFTGIITDAATGSVLWQRGQAQPRTPASTTKLLTSTAALLTLPPDQRITTTVVAGADPGTAVIVGAGDPTLTTLPAGKDGLFPGAARISDLAQQLRGKGIERIQVDTSLFTGDQMAQGWDRADIAGGDIAPIQALTADSGRVDPAKDESPRSPQPALAVGKALAAGLGLPASSVTDGTAPAGAQVLAKVTSAPLTDRLRQLMVLSDNVAAQQVGMEVAAATGEERSITGAARAVLKVLQGKGFDVTGVTLHDTNGLSVDDRIPAAVLDEVITAAAGPDHPQLRPLLDYLPIAGATGTLSDRYTTANRAGAGYVRAKTGSLSGVSTLAGYVSDDDGRILTFTLMSSGTPVDVARPAMDAITTALKGCGCR
ncbi:D-alanyl-D-alanine carboxypeptidase/D-alanyl-D-alanine-endopeptidase [Tsukamurella sp. 8F]|uniref:D-alanyl-D-alanine carboxypeptidase/D-alanyl-D-alanine endopeptidase n=1 Tax=unclassified Tsukamurella TaxID=2633480 RepID=UPI0023B99373|nr:MULTISPECIES: D-alanyl-D-alanine carboxypeptidase/D-alanyl-D-alanine-endopeptidase [unclassified Tsukamurella]MDF0530926.1 D-alanyl-D-alanine carboxypeptidase/D-alanyl-D-alanine-endopeptidase [Tsukamurella sp. 8J]MDF0588251.1 D-alanyl-D-alanine carboxypeptidase/D-alanyl-D-alanine-endopeptidase [Tsukamurella sp. 8F]